MATLVAAAGLALTACGGSSGGGGGAAQAGSGTGTIRIWAHQGAAEEAAAIKAAVDGFNSSQTGVKADLRFIPEADYTKTVTAAKVGDLGDVVEMDGPTIGSYVYNKKLSPLPGFVSDATIGNATTAITTQGTVDGKLYALGIFDSGLGIWGNKKLLDAAGVKYPTSLSGAWTAEEFTAALKALAGKDADGKVLDIKRNYANFQGEWGTFGFSPVVYSAGGALLKDGKATGALNTGPVAAAMRTVQSWKPYADPNSKDDAFVTGKDPLSWVGHWEYPRYVKALGKDLVLMPQPDFGNGVKSGNGSWAWGISAASKNAKAAGSFLDYLLKDVNVAGVTKANGAPPGTKTALAANPNYAPGGPLALYSEQLAKSCPGTATAPKDCVAVTRPVTAGYPTVTKSFSDALAAIYNGADPKAELDKAARTIDTDFSDNDGYRTK